MKPRTFLQLFLASILIVCFQPFLATAQDASSGNTALDKRVKAFLDNRQGTWHDMNVPASDGKLLYDIIVENGYTRALEIGTSTGHSGIWIAWALSKTGGKLITIEINESRHREALANFEKAGLADYIDARLADAHELAKELEGPFDFVFSDADKGWYKQYFVDLSPKLEVGGCFTAHNIPAPGSRRRGYGMSGTLEFINYVKGLDNYKTTVDNSGNGLSISYKREEDQ
jgi:caffeoyl-CoA O-methyltransferase